MSAPEIDLPNYVNLPAESALDDLLTAPDYAKLAALLNALRTEQLVVDVTGGTNSKRKGTRTRTLRTAKGQLVLPIFTSMNELRKAVVKGEAKGAIMPAQEALALIRTQPFVAIELNPGSAKQVILRKFVELVLGGEEITASKLEAGV
ncbi:SseB family protein [Canibacter zhoujuaniae]|uniref:SseB family protein n=1 Tax=Canibacter zhoujuaniae TaxID=2708343 RepID=UPI001423BA14|nr:SseB family protein [Canibacter zhoujuaniae]